MSTRSLILQCAAELLANSASGDVSTRAVCQAAGVGQPVLYRLFGDKDGLLAAVADQVWNEYLATKRAAVSSEDPIEDLRTGWDRHTAFALAHPHAYRLVFATSMSARPAAADEAMGLLQGILDRLAAQGRLRMTPADAARTVMAANSGVALAILLRPQQYPDTALSATMREATLQGILTDAAAEPDAQRIAATTLQAGLQRSTRFSHAESALLHEWLGRVQQP
ncbi:TetR/AcrR family transcriptional regulator [Tomitella fengzijianii]|uniref:TetR/AcrR family transcriptional regulator n=1 Tax=Tomitella fengzijianii TaxID=2597660 RepID=A0A516X3Q5_9ACTN|nr:TetR/AcrR family transcriptional regulator [Tomitella fengzijianii]QDQ97709.1 TetR/AcrR family transcriptional regulator [Tomitella fengzijianii]